MTAGRGYSSWVSLLKEVTYGTDPGTTRGGWARLVSEKIKVDKSYFVAPGLGQRGVRGVLEGVNVIRGQLDVETNFEGGWYGFVNNMMGAYVFQGSTPVATVNTHNYQPSDTVFNSHSMELARGYVGAAGVTTTKVFLYKGLVVNTGSFRLQQDSLMGFSMEVIAQTETPDVTQNAAPTYPTDLPIKNVYYNPSYAATLAIAVGSNVATLQSATINYDNKLGLRPNLSSLTAQPLPTDRREITVDLEADFEDTVIYSKFLNETEGAFQLVLTGPIITGSTRYKVQFDGTTSHMTGDTPNVDGPGYLRQNIKLWLVKSTPEFAMTVVNQQVTLGATL